MIGVAVIPALVILGYVAFVFWTPRYQAVADLNDDFGFNLRLDYYRTEAGSRDSGRYLSVITPSAYNTFNLPGWDWAHKARTSVYRIDGNHIAVLSAMGNDYKVTVKPFAYAPVVSDSGEGWQYLGAFEFAFSPSGHPYLRFFDRQLAECVPMGSETPEQWAGKARPQVRRASCPTVQTRD